MNSESNSIHCFFVSLMQRFRYKSINFVADILVLSIIISYCYSSWSSFCCKFPIFYSYYLLILFTFYILPLNYWAKINNFSYFVFLVYVLFRLANSRCLFNLISAWERSPDNPKVTSSNDPTVLNLIFLSTASMDCD